MFLCDVFKVLCYGASLALTVSLVYHNNISIGQFGACIAAFLSVQTSLKNVLQDTARIGELSSYASDFYNFLDINPSKSGTLRKRIDNEIAAVDVGFKYPNSTQYAVQQLSFSIRKGERIAIIGENGSGKTTLTKLLLGLYHCDMGCIQIDGYSLDTLDKDVVNQSLSIVSQNFRGCPKIRGN